MELNKKNRKYFWTKKIISRFGGRREKEIFRNRKSVCLLSENIVEIKSEIGICQVYIPEYNEKSCCICG